MDHFPKVPGENKKYLKPPPRKPIFNVRTESGADCLRDAFFLFGITAVLAMSAPEKFTTS